jgi:hypothetical protein
MGLRSIFLAEKKMQQSRVQDIVHKTRFVPFGPNRVKNTRRLLYQISLQIAHSRPRIKLQSPTLAEPTF